MHARGEEGHGVAKRPGSLLNLWREHGSVPPLKIVIMVAGTRGDVQPLTALAVRLQQHGHTVRLATHEAYKELVHDNGVHYFPLGGDPKMLMDITVRAGGMLPSHLGDMMTLRSEYRKIIFSTWDACTAPLQPAVGAGASGIGTSGSASEDECDHSDEWDEWDDWNDDKCDIHDGSTHGGSKINEAHSTEVTGRQASHMDASTKDSTPFKPSLIIATPITYGAIHCAEKLQVPLHVVAMVPWSPSRYLNHPWARAFNMNFADMAAGVMDLLLPPLPKLLLRGLPFLQLYDALRTWVRGSVKAAANLWSTKVLDRLSWYGIADICAALRVKLGLNPWGRNNRDASVLHKLPTTYAFSPNIFPPPVDWGPHITVAGPWLLRHARPDKQVDYSPPSELARFLAAGEKPIYIGFGSATIMDMKGLMQAIHTAVRKAGVRAVVLRAKSADPAPALTTDPDLQTAGSLEVQRTGSIVLLSQSNENILFVSDVPHDWLFPRCAGVVHHGGAGTTIAGLTAGCPTLICPSYGDNFFWSEVCAGAGVGPRGPPLSRITAHKLQAGIEQLLQPAYQQAAHDMSARLERERGLDRAVESIYRHLSVQKVLEVNSNAADPSAPSKDVGTKVYGLMDQLSTSNQHAGGDEPPLDLANQEDMAAYVADGVGVDKLRGQSTVGLMAKRADNATESFFEMARKQLCRYWYG